MRTVLVLRAMVVRHELRLPWWVIGAVLATVVALIALGSITAVQPIEASPTASGLEGILSGTTDDNGYFRIPHGGRAFDYAVVAVQHENGDWHTVEQSSRVQNSFWWNSTWVEGRIASPQFRRRAVRVYLLRGDAVVPGRTNGGGHFAVETKNYKFDFALVAVQRQNGNWHTLERSNVVSNNFWWMKDKKAVQGWIESGDFFNREVRVVLLRNPDGKQWGEGSEGRAKILKGKTWEDGHFAIDTNGMSVQFALVAIQHKNGDWHPLETSNAADNNFWWMPDVNTSVQGWIESPSFKKREMRAFVYYYAVEKRKNEPTPVEQSGTRQQAALFKMVPPFPGGNVYYIPSPGWIVPRGTLQSVKNISQWTMALLKPGAGSQECCIPDKAVLLEPGQSTRAFEGTWMGNTYWMVYCIRATAWTVYSQAPAQMQVETTYATE